MTRILIYAQFAILGAILLLLPNMTRRSLLFAVQVAADFRRRPEARRALGMFRWAVAIAAAVGLLAQAISASSAVNLAATLALLVVTGVAYYKANRLIAPFAVKSDGTRSVVLSETPERLPRVVWLAIAPFVLLAAAAVYLQLHWASIPLRFPIHFDMDGTPNGWAERTIKGVYWPLVFGAELCAWFVICGLAGWYGARRTHMRLTMLEIMLGVEFALSLLFATIALLPLLAIPIWAVAASPLCLMIPVVVVAIKRSSEPSDPPEKTPDECWKGGVLYYNPNDPVVFLEKRAGFGYTMNFANPWAWALLGGLAVVLGTAPLVLTGK